MSRSSFAAEFRAQLGTTPAEYLLRWRVSLAQSMLRKGASVKAASDALGYASAAAFSRAFTQAVGNRRGLVGWLRGQVAAAARAFAACDLAQPPQTGQHQPQVPGSGTASGWVQSSPLAAATV